MAGIVRNGQIMTEGRQYPITMHGVNSNVIWAEDDICRGLSCGAVSTDLPRHVFSLLVHSQTYTSFQAEPDPA